jgi:hypothetical protein
MPKRRNIPGCILLPALFTLLSGCRHVPEAKVREKEINIVIDRFEKEIFTVDPTHSDSLVGALRDQYGSFFDLFTQQIASIGHPDHPDFPASFRAFITDYYNYAAYRRSVEVFPDLMQLEKSLNTAFGNIRYYFPDMPVPRIITFVSGFRYSVVSDSGLLAIGLDKYLGPKEELYSSAGIYNYLRVNMHRDKISSDCMRLWAETEFPFNDSLNTLLGHMVYNGMIMHFVKTMLPDEPDTLLWGFSANQMNFCLNNEKQMWTYLVENKMLFLTDRFTIDKFTREGPFTKDFSTESPARAAVWIGYRIAEKYQARNKDIVLKDLMKETDYQKILSLSGYNP